MIRCKWGENQGTPNVSVCRAMIGRTTFFSNLLCFCAPSYLVKRKRAAGAALETFINRAGYFLGAISSILFSSASRRFMAAFIFTKSNQVTFLAGSRSSEPQTTHESS